MALSRPVVLVYQEFASLSSSPATPELNVLIAGPAYHIQDFLDDRSNIKVATTYGTRNAAATGSSVAPLNNADAVVVASPPNNIVGAVLDAASVKVYLGAPAIEIAHADDAVTAPDVTTITSILVDFEAEGVLAGDSVILTKLGVGDLVRTVRSVSGKVITCTDEMPAAGYTKVRVERTLADAQVPANKVVVAGQTITVKGGLTLETKPVASADVYVAYRALRTDLQEVRYLNDFNALKGVFGRTLSSGTLHSGVDARNPLAVGAMIALLNTNTPVQIYGIPTDDLAGYLTMKADISPRKDVYAVVPLTTDSSVVAALKADFENLADPAYAIANGVPQKFRVVIGSVGELPTYGVIVDVATDGETKYVNGESSTVDFYDANATFIDDHVAPGQYLEVPTDLAATSLASSQKFVVASVLSNQRIKVTAAHAALAEATNVVYRIVKALDKDGQVSELVSVAQSFRSRRCVLCWPDKVDVSSLTDGSLTRGADGAAVAAASQPGYYLACAVGGMTAGLPSHQGFTNLGIAGISKLYNVNTYFSDRQITQISNNGWLVFQQDTPSSLPYVVHQCTTDPSTLQFGEFSMVKNFDFVSMFFSDILDDYIGIWNINPETIGFIGAALSAGVENLKLRRRVRIGAPIIDAKVTKLGESAISEDRLEIYIEVDFPKPLNTVGLHLVSV
jgi:hypothetical protein